ncbi:MAG TPA: Imm49 family immunity protein [Myxococcaceae bacterium]|nr:Imm49 family immunity protein [Myxococcaceae bacterium]
MGIKELEFTNENIGQLIDLRLAELRKGTVHPKHVLDVSLLYRRMACGLLLANYDADGFFYCLYQAADAWLQFLERKHLWPHLDPYYMARGRAEPLLDALALGDVELARRIDALAETQWQQGLEYPEDFRFFLLLPRLVSPTVPREELVEELERMERALEGAEYPRHDVLRALVLGEARGFEEGLLAAIEAWQARMEKERRSGVGNPYALATDANVFIEGLALVRVARARGLPTRSQYPLIPPVTLSEPRTAIHRRRIW